MATVTPNFNWPVPTSTDLVKDGATAIEALGDSIDGSLVDLKGGTSGQVLSKNSNTDMDFVWVTSDDANAIQNTIVDAKGDLIAATAADTPARLAVGANDTVLTADSTTATGLKWAAPASGGGMTLISTTTLTGSTVTLSSFSGYTDLQLVIVGAYGGNQLTFHGRFNSDTGNNYGVGQMADGDNQNFTNKATLGDGLSSSSTNVTLRNYTLMNIQRYAGSHGKPYQVFSGYTYWNNTAVNYVATENGIYTSATAITSIDLFLSSGNFSGGTAYLYGVK
jgi:hypothetical protein